MKKTTTIYKYILPLSTSGNGVICKNAKMALNLSDVIHDENILLRTIVPNFRAIIIYYIMSPVQKKVGIPKCQKEFTEQNWEDQNDD